MKTKQDEAKAIVNAMTDYVNSFRNINDEFNYAMSLEHRTLQQSFTRLCLKWIEYVASDSYKFDPRNRQSHEVCKMMIEGYEKFHPLPDYYLSPAESLPFI